MNFDDMEKLDLDTLRNMTTDDGTDINVMVRRVAARFMLGSLLNLYDRPTDGSVYERLMLFLKKIDTAKTAEEIDGITGKLVAFAETAVDERERMFKEDLCEYTDGDIEKASEVLCVNLPSDYFDDIRKKKGKKKGKKKKKKGRNKNEKRT